MPLEYDTFADGNDSYSVGVVRLAEVVLSDGADNRGGRLNPLSKDVNKLLVWTE